MVFSTYITHASGFQWIDGVNGEARACCRVVIVSSGAVGVGAQRLGLHARPSKLPQKQALAAVGQVHLMRFYDDFFSAIGLVGNAEHLHPFCGGCQS